MKIKARTQELAEQIRGIALILPAKQREKYLTAVETLAKTWPKQAAQASPAEPVYQGTGEAYWFFRSENSAQEIEESLPVIRDFGEVRPDAEITLLEEKVLRQDSKLNSCLKRLEHMPQADYSGINYALRSRVPRATTKQAKAELDKIMDAVYDWDYDANKLKFTCHREIGDSYIWAGNRLLEYNS